MLYFLPFVELELQLKLELEMVMEMELQLQQQLEMELDLECPPKWDLQIKNFIRWEQLLIIWPVTRLTQTNWLKLQTSILVDQCPRFWDLSPLKGRLGSQGPLTSLRSLKGLRSQNHLPTDPHVLKLLSELEVTARLAKLPTLTSLTTKSNSNISVIMIEVPQ